MKKLLALIAMTVTTALSGPALAHGEKPKHGGVIANAGAMHVELAGKDGKAVIYLEDDHGKPVPTKGVTGKLTVLNGSRKQEMALEPAGENTLVSKDEAKLVKGTKAVAAITLSDKKTVNARFSMK